MKHINNSVPLIATPPHPISLQFIQFPILFLNNYIDKFLDLICSTSNTATCHSDHCIIISPKIISEKFHGAKLYHHLYSHYQQTHSDCLLLSPPLLLNPLINNPLFCSSLIQIWQKDVSFVSIFSSYILTSITFRVGWWPVCLLWLGCGLQDRLSSRCQATGDSNLLFCFLFFSTNFFFLSKFKPFCFFVSFWKKIKRW